MIQPVHIGAATLYHGDAAAVLPTLDADSFDALVCDPPAGIAFMGKAWDRDHGGRDHWVREYAAIFAECLRALKPGAHGLVWALPRTSHWTAMALEDAGLEIRDRVAHLFGSGFPKSLNVGAAIDKAAGAERTRLRGVRSGVRGGTFAQDAWSKENWDSVLSVEPLTDDARQWQGFGTALKPAVEDWWLVRKPLSERNVAANVLRWGTGAINVDGCRVACEGEGPAERRREQSRRSGDAPVSERTAAEAQGEGRIERRGDPAVYLAQRPGEALGRWPANLILGCACDTDAHEPDCAVAMLDAQSGSKCGAVAPVRGTEPSRPARNVYGETGRVAGPFHADSGGASRFFYCAKAPRSDRGEGNTHPTVKNTALMRYLCRLVTPPGGAILDAFAGSGSTLVAAVAEGFRAVGIERDADSIATAARRLSDAQGPLFTAQRAIA